MRNYRYLSILVKALRFLSTFASSQKEHYTNTIQKNASHIWASELEQYAKKIESSVESPELIKDVELTTENLREAVKIARDSIEQLKKSAENLGKDHLMAHTKLPESGFNQLIAMYQIEIDDNREGPTQWNKEPLRDFARTYLNVPDNAINDANVIEEAFKKAFASIPEDAQNGLEGRYQQITEIKRELMYLEKVLVLLCFPPGE